MRLSRYFIFLFIITFLGLSYTHQQFLIVKANYNIRNCETQLSQILDRSIRLMYNVSVLESPARLEVGLAASGSDYDIPRRWVEVREEKSESTYELAKAVERSNTVFERILNLITLKSEAQAFEK